MSNEELVKLIREGIDVTNNLGVLYQQNMKHIKTICSKFSGCGAIDIDDLIQESYFALLSAVNHYDLTGQAKFMTYAEHCIRFHCLKYLEKNRGTIHIPNWLLYKIKGYKKVYKQCNGDPDQIMKELGLSPEQYSKLIKSLSASRTISLDANILTNGDDDNYTLVDTLADDTDTEQEIIDAEIERLMLGIWDYLDDLHDDRKKTIMLLRYKLNLTQHEIAENIGVADSTVSYIEIQSLKQLRELEDIQRLANLYDYDCDLSYKTGLKAYKENGFVSPVELIAEKHIDLDRRLKAIQDDI